MKSRLHIPIAFKLIVVTVGLLLGVSGWIALESTHRFEKISTDREEQANLEQSWLQATEVEQVLLAYIDKIRVVGSLLLKQEGAERDRSLELSFGHDRDLVAVEILPAKPAPGAAPIRVVNEDYLHQYKLDKSFIGTLRLAQKSRGLVHLETLFAGKEGYFEIRNSTIEGGAPLFTIGFPLAKDEMGEVTHIVLAEIRLDRLQKVFSSVSEHTLYLIDNEGRLLAHADENKVLKNESMREVPIVKTALASSFKKGQIAFKDPATGRSLIGAYTKTSLGVTTISVADKQVILEAARNVRREAFNIAGQSISVALLLMFLVSITLSAPIESLVELTRQVAKGNFAVKASVRSRDEVGQLGEAFNHMIQGLVERDRVKNMFSKFHGSSVTEDLMKSDLQLGGSKKMVTVFFSDIRDFTKFSEGHSPEQVVEMLNEYFQIMVRIINDHGGVVDKFIGDAIMAVWGAPAAQERDSQNAVKAAIQMRVELNELNQRRAARDQVAIKIGMGLHRGEAISGTIGSSERMEYTVIGDTVNQASRIEASTKSFGTDLLLSEDMAEFVRPEFILEMAGQVEVKGKTEPLKLFKVRGYFDEQNNPIEIRTPYSDYEAGHDAKVKIA
jgi:adenylate cyclase